LNFADTISKNGQISNFVKIGAVRAELFHADERTDVMKLSVALRNFATAPKTQHHSGEFQVGIHEWYLVSSSGVPIDEWTSELFQFILR
jgi:acyl-[acyl carrier protein]--UDP-N-acetylglucosamine O-acyltransferase